MQFIKALQSVREDTEHDLQHGLDQTSTTEENLRALCSVTDLMMTHALKIEP